MELQALFQLIDMFAMGISVLYFISPGTIPHDVLKHEYLITRSNSLNNFIAN
jgi:hypothetical protein